MRRAEGLGLGPSPVRAMLVAAVCTAAAGAALANPDLARQQGCLGCHAVTEKLVGPAFSEIAKRYAGKPEAAGMLAKSIVAGSKGVWGDMPMPPQPQLSAQQADVLARWVLLGGN